MDKTKIVGVFSAKGGVGKTTTVSNIGAALAIHFDKKICLVDGNVTASGLGLHFGLYYPSVSLNDIIKKRISITSAIFPHPSGVSIIPSSISADTSGVDIKNLRSLLRKIDGYDYIILDSPPCLSKETFSVLNAADQLLVVTTPDLPAATDAARVIRVAKKNGSEVLGVLVNRVKRVEYELTKNEIEALCDSKIIGVIPEDETVPRSIADGVPAFIHSPFSNSSKAMGEIASKLCGEDYRSPGILDRFKKLIGLEQQKQKRTLIEVEKKQTGVNKRELKKYKEPEIKNAPTMTRREIVGGVREELIKTLRNSVKTGTKGAKTKRRRK